MTMPMMHKKGCENSKLPGAVASKYRGTNPNLDPTASRPLNRNNPWFDEKGLLATLKIQLEAGRTSAFQYNGRAYYALDIVARALNGQRGAKDLDSLNPPAVIEFFKSDRGLGERQVCDAVRYGVAHEDLPLLAPLSWK